MLPVRITVTGIGISAPIPIDRYRNPSGSSIGVTISATATYTVEYTYDDVFAAGYSPGSGIWFPHPTLTAKTANADGNLAYPATALRLNVSASTGTATINYITAGIQ